MLLAGTLLQAVRYASVVLLAGTLQQAVRYASVVLLAGTLQQAVRYASVVLLAGTLLQAVGYASIQFCPLFHATKCCELRPLATVVASALSWLLWET